jgi:hypothetical protein
MEIETKNIITSVMVPVKISVGDRFILPIGVSNGIMPPQTRIEILSLEKPLPLDGDKIVVVYENLEKNKSEHMELETMLNLLLKY